MANDVSLREFLNDYYGTPVHATSPSNDFIVLRYASEEAARVSAFCNERYYGLPGEVEERPDGWHVLLDLRPAIAEMQRPRVEQQGEHWAVYSQGLIDPIAFFSDRAHAEAALTELQGAPRG